MFHVLMCPYSSQYNTSRSSFYRGREYLWILFSFKMTCLHVQLWARDKGCKISIIWADMLHVVDKRKKPTRFYNCLKNGFCQRSNIYSNDSSSIMCPGSQSYSQSCSIIYHAASCISCETATASLVLLTAPPVAIITELWPWCLYFMHDDACNTR